MRGVRGVSCAICVALVTACSAHNVGANAIGPHTMLDVRTPRRPPACCSSSSRLVFFRYASGTTFDQPGGTVEGSFQKVVVNEDDAEGGVGVEGGSGGGGEAAGAGAEATGWEERPSTGVVHQGSLVADFQTIVGRFRCIVDEEDEDEEG